jgi:hypothetical protein
MQKVFTRLYLRMFQVNFMERGHPARNERFAFEKRLLMHALLTFARQAAPCGQDAPSSMGNPNTVSPV